jgi:hypothetical protein
MYFIIYQYNLRPRWQSKTAMSYPFSSVHEKQLVNKLLYFNGTQSFSTTFQTLATYIEPQIFTPYFCKIHFILPYLCPGHPGVPNGLSIHTSKLKFCMYYITFPSCSIHLILLDLLTPFIFKEEYKLHCTEFSTINTASSLCDPSIFLNQHLKLEQIVYLKKSKQQAFYYDGWVRKQALRSHEK